MQFLLTNVIISDIKATQFSDNLVWVFFQTVMIFGFTFGHVPKPTHGIATTNSWVDQRAVCSITGYHDFNDYNFRITWSNLKKKIMWKLIRLQFFSIAYLLKIKTFLPLKYHSQCNNFFRLNINSNRWYFWWYLFWNQEQQSFNFEPTIGIGHWV